MAERYKAGEELGAGHQSNLDAFEAERDSLVQTHRGYYVAYFEGRRICEPQKTPSELHEAVRDIIKGKSYFAPKIQTKAEAQNAGAVRARSNI